MTSKFIHPGIFPRCRTAANPRIRFFARISHVFPPAAVRETADAERLNTVKHPIASTSTAKRGHPSAAAVDDYSSVVHKIGGDLRMDPAEARAEDDPAEYLYTVQLMDEDHKFEGSFMEVKSKIMTFVPTLFLSLIELAY